MKKVGVIGAGNMGQAMVGGILSSGMLKSSDVVVSSKDDESLKVFREGLSDWEIETTTDNSYVASNSEVIILAIKPIAFFKVLDDIKDVITDKTVLVSIAAGISIGQIEKYIGKPVKVFRAMPNIPAIVGCGMTAVCHNDLVNEFETEFVDAIFKSFGEIEFLPERLMDAVTATSGSSPAYVFMFIEAMADGAVLDGIPRRKAYRMAAQTVMGAAKMLLELDQHPGELKDMVTSPGGTTIEALAKLEQAGFRSTIIEAMRSCTNKSKQLFADGNK